MRHACVGGADGSGRLAILCCVHLADQRNTKHTLEFATDARKIEINPTANEARAPLRRRPRVRRDAAADVFDCGRVFELQEELERQAAEARQVADLEVRWCPSQPPSTVAPPERHPSATGRDALAVA